MRDIEYKSSKPTTKWYIKSGFKGVAIEVSCFEKFGGGFGWCWYLRVSDSHEAFSNLEFIESLPFHSGVTYSKLVCESYNCANGKDVEFLEKNKLLNPIKVYVVGCDFQHLYDTLEYCDPIHGVPHEIEVNIKLVMSEFCKTYKYKHPQHYLSVYSNGIS